MQQLMIVRHRLRSNAGVSRSASVVIAYLMHKHKMPFKDAHDRLKAAKYATRHTARTARI